MPDVIVIGGGVVGTMTAWHLAESGASVTLLERGAIASGATGRSQGLVLPPDHAELVPLWRESIAVYTRLAGEHGADFCFDREPIGTLLLATHEGQL
ncbi:MAG: FAD-dependent oxidoreductase, partial [Gaiellales bacterium]